MARQKCPPPPPPGGGGGEGQVGKPNLRSALANERAKLFGTRILTCFGEFPGNQVREATDPCVVGSQRCVRQFDDVFWVNGHTGFFQSFHPQRSLQAF